MDMHVIINSFDTVTGANETDQYHEVATGITFIQAVESEVTRAQPLKQISNMR